MPIALVKYSSRVLHAVLAKKQSSTNGDGTVSIVVESCVWLRQTTGVTDFAKFSSTDN